MNPLGREQELAAVERFLAGAAEAPSMLVLRGAAGIGKTTVWRAGLESATERGMVVVSTRPTPTEAALAYGGLGDVLRPFQKLIPRLPPPQRRALRVALVLADPGQTAPDERAVAAAAASVLRLAAEREPIVVAVDDLQWLDLSSWTALHFAARRAAEDGVRLLATMREGEPTANEVDDADVIELEALPLNVIDKLLRARGTRLSRLALERVASVSGGNPFFALQLCDAFERAGDALDLTAPLAVPPSLSSLLEERLRRVPARVRRALLVAALARDATPDLVCTVASVEESDLDLAVASGLLDPVGATLRFSHPLFGEALHVAASVQERRRAHAELARVVADPEERARHVAGSASGPDDDAAATLEWAGERARQRGAPLGAAEFGELSITLTPLGSPELHRRRLVAARAHELAGNMTRAASHLRDAIAGAVTARARAEAMWQLARLEEGVTLDDRVALNRQALELATGEPDLLAGIHKSLAFNLQTTDLDEAERHAEAAVGIAETLTDPLPLTMALSALGHIRVWRGRVDHALFERAIRLEDRCAEINAGDRPRLIYALALLDGAEQLDRARILFSEVMESCEGRSEGDVGKLHFYLSLAEWNMSRLREAWSHANEAAIIVEQFGGTPAGPLAIRAAVELDLGDEDAARVTAHEVIATATPNESWWASIARGVLAAIEIDGGRPAEALVLVDEAAMQNAVWVHRVRALVALERLDEARAAVTSVDDSPVGRFPKNVARVAWLRALIDAATGDPQSALTVADAALPLTRERPIERARLLLAIGSARRRLHQKAAARRDLVEAAEIFDEIGAKTWAANARAEADLVPGRRSEPGKLSPVEGQIAQLVGRGKSNAEVARELYLSPKTVEWNLSKVYRKLSVRSRAELAAKLARRSAADGS